MQFRGPVLGMLALAMTATTGLADSEGAFIVTRADVLVHSNHRDLRTNPEPGFHQIGYPQRQHVGIYVNPVLVPEATVDPAVSETPALPHLVKMKVGQTTTYIDPHVDYLSARPGRLDEGHSIIRAQRMHLALQGGRGYTVRSPHAMVSDETAEPIRPSAVIMKPNLLNKPRKDEFDGMPMIPAPQKDAPAVKTKQVAQAD